jgi:hypothetical protein
MWAPSAFGVSVGSRLTSAVGTVLSPVRCIERQELADNGFPSGLLEPDFAIWHGTSNRRSASRCGLGLTLPARSGLLSIANAVAQRLRIVGLTSRTGENSINKTIGGHEPNQNLYSPLIP